MTSSTPEPTAPSPDATAATTAPAGPFSGMTAIITGDIDGWTRDTVNNAITKMGGKPVSSVSGKTGLVIMGEGAGLSKMDKTRTFNHLVLDADGFVALADSFRNGTWDGQPIGERIKDYEARTDPQPEPDPVADIPFADRHNVGKAHTSTKNSAGRYVREIRQWCVGCGHGWLGRSPEGEPCPVDVGVCEPQALWPWDEPGYEPFWPPRESDAAPPEFYEAIAALDAERIAALPRSTIGTSTLPDEPPTPAYGQTAATPTPPSTPAPIPTVALPEASVTPIVALPETPVAPVTHLDPEPEPAITIPEPVSAAPLSAPVPADPFDDDFSSHWDDVADVAEHFDAWPDDEPVAPPAVVVDDYFGGADDWTPDEDDVWIEPATQTAAPPVPVVAVPVEPVREFRRLTTDDADAMLALSGTTTPTDAERVIAVALLNSPATQTHGIFEDSGHGEGPTLIATASLLTDMLTRAVLVDIAVAADRRAAGMGTSLGDEVIGATLATLPDYIQGIVFCRAGKTATYTQHGFEADPNFEVMFRG